MGQGTHQQLFLGGVKYIFIILFVFYVLKFHSKTK